MNLMRDYLDNFNVKDYLGDLSIDESVLHKEVQRLAMCHDKTPRAVGFFVYINVSSSQILGVYCLVKQPSTLHVRPHRTKFRELFTSEMVTLQQD